MKIFALASVLLLSLFSSLSGSKEYIGNFGTSQEAYRVFRFDHDGKTVGLQQMMEVSGTPSLSMAVNNGQIDTAFTATTSGEELSSTTLYRAGAASAGPLCVAVLQLVERGEINLDDKINDLLTAGKLRGGDNVTVRDLLHMRAFTNSGYKPDGYQEGEDRPTLTGVADGFRYKGIRKADKSTEYGGWVFLQLLLEQHYGTDFNSLMQREVFAPLGLKNTFYATELNEAQATRALMGHTDSGQPLSGGYRRYVALGAAGLWTTAQDYVTFTRAILDSSAGQADCILSPEIVSMALADRYGHRSLLFHLSDKGLPYWGGNARGYYFTMQAHPAEDWVAVNIMNRNLNWRLGGPVVWQLGLLGKQLRSDTRVGIILQEPEQNDPVIAELEHKYFTEGIRTERLLPEAGLPADITATPAFVFQSPKGRAIYSGRHNDAEAIRRFVRLSQRVPKKPVADVRTDVLASQSGRQQLVLPLKFTAPTGENAPAEWPEGLKNSLLTKLSTATGFTRQGNVELLPQDRRIYLDLHAYRMMDGRYQLTYALFSQFNCHVPVTTSYGKALILEADGNGGEQLAADIHKAIASLRLPENGYVPRGVPSTTPVRRWADLGWGLSAAVLDDQIAAEYAEPVAVRGDYQAQLTTSDAPALFFSFPAPLDRYAGEVNTFTANFNFSPTGQSISGRVDVPTTAISTGNGSLDTYVLDDVIGTKKYQMATLTFTEQPISSDWRTDQPLTTKINAMLNIRGKDHPTIVNATFTPRANGTLGVEAAFALDFKQVFKNDGPDGPEDKRRRLEFTTEFQLTSTSNPK